MNTKRVAELLRELADELEPPGQIEIVEAERPRARARVHPAPLHQPTELDMQRARKMLRRKGLAT